MSCHRSCILIQNQCHYYSHDKEMINKLQSHKNPYQRLTSTSSGKDLPMCDRSPIETLCESSLFTMDVSLPSFLTVDVALLLQGCRINRFPCFTRTYGTSSRTSRRKVRCKDQPLHRKQR